MPMFVYVFRYTREEPYPNSHLPLSLQACYRYCEAAHDKLTGTRLWRCYETEKERGWC